MATRDELKSRAIQIKNEVEEGRNTANRVGGLLEDFADSVSMKIELNNLKNSGYLYAGIATPTTNPGTPDSHVFYIATTVGSYSNFGNIEVSKGESAILKWNNGTWSKSSFKPMTDFNSVFDADGNSLTHELDTLGSDISELEEKVGNKNDEIITFTKSDDNGLMWNAGQKKVVVSTNEYFGIVLRLTKGIKYKFTSSVHTLASFPTVGQTDFINAYNGGEIFTASSDELYVITTAQSYNNFVKLTIYAHGLALTKADNDDLKDVDYRTSSNKLLGLSGKKISICGDSNFTYTGISTGDSSRYYDGSSIVGNWKDTFWGRFITKCGALIERNISVGSSSVTDNRYYDVDGFLTRADKMGNPDYIILGGGLNEPSNVEIGIFDPSKSTELLNTNVFADAYDKLWRIIKSNYSSAKVIVYIHPKTPTALTASIVEVATYYGAEIIMDGHAISNLVTYVDSVHYDASAMLLVSDFIYDEFAVKSSTSLQQSLNSIKENIGTLTLSTNTSPNARYEFYIHCNLKAGDKINVKVSTLNPFKVGYKSISVSDSTGIELTALTNTEWKEVVLLNDTNYICFSKNKAYVDSFGVIEVSVKCNLSKEVDNLSKGILAKADKTDIVDLESKLDALDNIIGSSEDVIRDFYITDSSGILWNGGQNKVTSENSDYFGIVVKLIQGVKYKSSSTIHTFYEYPQLNQTDFVNAYTSNTEFIASANEQYALSYAIQKDSKLRLTTYAHGLFADKADKTELKKLEHKIGDYTVEKEVQPNVAFESYVYADFKKNDTIEVRISSLDWLKTGYRSVNVKDSNNNDLLTLNTTEWREIILPADTSYLRFSKARNFVEIQDLVVVYVKCGISYRVAKLENKGNDYSLINPLVLGDTNKTYPISKFSVKRSEDIAYMMGNSTIQKIKDNTIDRAMFTLGDDDTIDVRIRDGVNNGRGGFLSTLYPVCASLGVKFTEAMEGWRCGFIGTRQSNGLYDYKPKLNTSGIAARALQKKGIEIACHTTTARFWGAYAVNSLSELSAKVSTATKFDYIYNDCLRAYVIPENKCYYLNSSRQWIEIPRGFEPPYLTDLSTDKYIGDCPLFDMEFQYVKYREIAKELGFDDIDYFITTASVSSHKIRAFVKKNYKLMLSGAGHSIDGSFYIIPPLCSSIRRVYGWELEENDYNNVGGEEVYQQFKETIDTAIAKKAYININIHTYRPCWANKIDSQLVSNGGTYPDSWVYPVSPVSEDDDFLSKPNPSTGLTDWSEWHPCPGTRLYELWRILKYMKENGDVVTLKEMQERIGNIYEVGDFCAGMGQTHFPTWDKKEYNHYVIGCNGSESYFVE